MEDDNDFAYMRRHKEKTAQERLNSFNSNYLDKLIAKGFIITYPSVGKITIVTFAEFGIVDYFPKANRILVRKGNSWFGDANGWIKRNLINER